MAMADYRLRTQAAFALAFLLLAATPSHAEMRPPKSCALVYGKSHSKFSRLVKELRHSPSFFQWVVEWKGEPSRCSGGINYEGSDGDAWWLTFFWPDGSELKATIMPPEIIIVEFTNSKGLARPDEIINMTHQYANESGMKINWPTPNHIQNGKLHVIEHTDPTGGPNIFFRYTYDQQQRLVGVWVSIVD